MRPHNQQGPALQAALVVTGHALHKGNHRGICLAVAPVSLPREEADRGRQRTCDAATLQIAFNEGAGRWNRASPGAEGSGDLRRSRRRCHNEFARETHHASDARIGTAGGAADRNPIALQGEFQTRLAVAARGAAPPPYVVAPTGQVEARRCLGGDVVDEHGGAPLGIVFGPAGANETIPVLHCSLAKRGLFRTRYPGAWRAPSRNSVR